MSLLPSATFAGPSQAEALWAVAGSTGPGGGVTQLVAGANITLDPPTGEGVVTINATGGGGGGVTEILSGGAGLGVSNPTGAVTLTNTGVTEIIAGTGISISGTTGAVTVTNTFATGLPTLSYQTLTPPTNFSVTSVGADVLKLTIPFDSLNNNGYACIVNREGWSSADVFTTSLITSPSATGGTSQAGIVEAEYTSGGVVVQFRPFTTGQGAGLNTPVIWFIRYAGVAIP